jgi:hypothetical protein
MEDTQPLKFFDATCMLGRWAAGVEQTPATASELAAEMAYYDLSEALVYHSVAMMYNPRLGNQRLMSDLAGSPNLHPCWVLMPHQTGEVDPPEQVVAAMLAQGVHAALLLPRSYRFFLRRWNIGPLLARLAEHRIPLFVDFGQRHWDGELVDWDGIEEVCVAYPALPVVLVRADLNSNRRLFPLMERLPNLHIETSYYVVHRGIELLCRAFGAHRVLFGSGLPFRDPGPAITALMYSQISEPERALVGGGNLRRLLGEVV